MKDIKFKTIGIEDSSIIQQYTEKYLPYSDFNPLSLICWNANNDNSYAILESNLVIKIKDYLTDNYVCSLLGLNNLDKVLPELFKITDKLKFVPEFMLEKISSNYSKEEDRDSFDYIIRTKTLISLVGNKLKTVRKNVNTFVKEYPGYEIKIIDLNKPKDVDLITDLNKKWCSSKSFNKIKTDEDMHSINKFIKYSKFFNTFTVGIFVEGALIAFTFNEILRNGWAMGHFGKSISSYNKSSCFVEYATSLKLQEIGCEIINIEQDTGLPGLRETKNSFAPDHFLKKYTIKRL